MSHADVEACTHTQRLAAGRVDGYQVTGPACRNKRPSTWRTCCASCGSSGKAASCCQFYLPVSALIKWQNTTSLWWYKYTRCHSVHPANLTGTQTSVETFCCTEERRYVDSEVLCRSVAIRWSKLWHNSNSTLDMTASFAKTDAQAAHNPAPMAWIWPAPRPAISYITAVSDKAID